MDWKLSIVSHTNSLAKHCREKQSRRTFCTLFKMESLAGSVITSRILILSQQSQFNEIRARLEMSLTIRSIFTGDLKHSRECLLISIAKWTDLLCKCLGNEEDTNILSFLRVKVEGRFDV